MGGIISSHVGVVAACKSKKLNLRGKQLGNTDIDVISRELMKNLSVTEYE